MLSDSSHWEQYIDLFHLFKVTYKLTMFDFVNKNSAFFFNPV